MASFVIETWVPRGDPDRFGDEVDRLRAATAEAKNLDHPVRHVRSYFVPSDEMGFHEVEAERLDAVESLAALAGIDVERVVGAIGVGQGRRGE